MSYRDALQAQETTRLDEVREKRQLQAQSKEELKVENAKLDTPEKPDLNKDPFENHRLDPYNYVNRLMRDGSAGGKLDAANFLIKHLGHNVPEIEITAVAEKYLNTVWHSFLDADMYLEAATMNWGFDLVDCRPAVVEELSNFLRDENLMAIIGASSMSKSYFVVAWLYLDYQRDPDYTSIKLVTISASKLESLLFSPLLNLHEQSVMDVVGKKESGFRFTHKPKNVNVGFQGLLVPQDQKGTGKIKGIKYYRRPEKHPKFGNKTRTRIFIDEFQDTSSSIINELASPASQISDGYSMKIVLSGNPTDYALAEAFGILTEPPDGWLSLDMEKDTRWKSKRGYEVYRLDGKNCENVIYQKNYCPGMMSWQAYENFARDPESAEYWTFARGMFPIQGGVNTLFSMALLEGAMAKAIFHEGSTPCAFLDVGLRQDKAVLAIGRIGKATGRISRTGDRVLFTNDTDQSKIQSRIILYCETIIEITSHYGDSVKLALEVRKLCTQHNILPNYVGVDTTGLGEGTTSYLANYFGRVLAVHNSESPSDVKILQEDKQLPHELYSRTIDEIWYASHKWFSVGSFLINPDVENHNKLFEEMTTRKLGRNVSNNGRRRIESKAEWKARHGNKSPDFADAVNGLCHVARMRTNLVPAMEKESEVVKKSVVDFDPPNVDYVENLHYNALKVEKKRPPSFSISKLRKTHVVGEYE